MVLTTRHEEKLSAGVSHAACFQRTDLRRTIIVMGCYVMEVMSGSAFRALVTYFLQQGGLPTTQAFNMSIVSYALGMAGVFVAVRMPQPQPQALSANLADTMTIVVNYAARRTSYAFSLRIVCHLPPVPDYRHTGHTTAQSPTSQHIMANRSSFALFTLRVRRDNRSNLIHARS